MRRSKIIVFMMSFVLIFSSNISDAKIKASDNSISLHNPRNVTFNLNENTDYNDYGLRNPVGNVSYIEWDCIYFGNYYQSNNSTKEPIKWRVLSVEGNDAFLISDKNLDVMPFNEDDRTVTWENCTLRSWLNGYGSNSNRNKIDYSSDNFMDSAFNSDEKEAIINVKVKNENNSYYGTSSGEATYDKIYLLSEKEAYNSIFMFRFDSYADEARCAKNTQFVEDGGTGGCDCIDDWWLRTSGNYPGTVSYVNIDGSVNKQGCCNFNKEAVRPVLHLDLSNESVWEYAEPVKAKVKVEKCEWDYLYFGNYYQKNNRTKEPIKWRVLSVEGNDAFIISDKNLDVTWEKSTLRSWLNGYNRTFNDCNKDFTNKGFIDTAFTEDERNAILQTNVKNVDNSIYDTDGGKDTKDKIFILSLEEAKLFKYGFMNDRFDCNTRLSVDTQYVEDGGSFNNRPREYAGAADYWLLRTPGDTQKFVTYVDNFGGIDEDGTNVYDDGTTIRPVLHLDLSKTKAWKNKNMEEVCLHSQKLINYKDATCTSEGYSGDLVCSKCGKTLSEGEVIPELGHDWALVEQELPTCTEKGYSKFICRRCGEFEEMDVKDALGHDYELKIHEDATVDYEGRDVYICKICNERYVIKIPRLNNNENGNVTSETETNKNDSTINKKSSESIAGKKILKFKLVGKKGKIKVSFAKMQNATSYEIQISTNRKFKKAKKYTIKKTSKTLKNLKRKKTYYVRVRAVSGNTKSKWVKKKIKTK